MPATITPIQPDLDKRAYICYNESIAETTMINNAATQKMSWMSAKEVNILITPWKKRWTIPNPQVRDAADQFDGARLLLDKQPSPSGVLSPLLNNAAIALELYLKCLGAVSVYTPAPGSVVSRVTAKPLICHGLIDLLEEIPQDIRESLESEYAAAHTNRALRGDRRQYEGLFTASRYPFEKNKDIREYPPRCLMDLCSFLGDFTANMKEIDRIEQ